MKITFVQNDQGMGGGGLRMTLKEVLDLMDHEVWVRVRVHDGSKANPSPADDLVLWSADWIGGGEDDPGMPDGLKSHLGWDADDLSIEYHPTGRQKPTPMIVVNAYQYGAEEPA